MKAGVVGDPREGSGAAPEPRGGRELRLQALDFSDLRDEEEGGEEGEGDPRPQGSPPCPPPGRGPPPPPLPPPAGAPGPGLRPTQRLHWRGISELPQLPRCCRFGPSTIWEGLQPLTLDTARLRRLFQRAAGGSRPLQRPDGGRREELNVLPLKRSNGINIALAALPAPHIILAAVLSFDRCALDREAIERLQTMVPSEEEVGKIQEAQRSNPGVSVGRAERFLLMLASVPELTARLNLWAFMFDYDAREKEIAEPLFDLKLGMEQLAGNRTFRCILATLLAIGNFLNGVNARGFQLCYLERVPGVRDTVLRRPLLHHACAIILQSFPDTSDLLSEITGLSRSSKVDFVQLQADLAQLEQSCKASWDDLKAIGRRDRDAAFLGSTAAALRECAQRIIVLKAVCRRVRNRFHSFLLYLGYPNSYVRKATIGGFCKMISDFALEYHVARHQILQQRERQEREKERQQGVRGFGEIDTPPSVGAVTRHTFLDPSQQHEDMKEILSTPERSRKFDNSLPRSRRKKEILDQKKFPW